MATRAAIAAQDRNSREKIASQDRNFQKKKWREEAKLRDKKNTIDSISAAGSALRGMGSAASAIMAANDPEWYKKYGYDPYAATLPDFYRLGTDPFQNWRHRNSLTPHKSVVPGVLVFKWVDTIPNPNETNVLAAKHYQNSPINESLTRFMANLRKMNSRIGEYDPADLGLYWYALRSHLALLGVLYKAITIYNTYFATNAYFARYLIEAIGFDPDDFNSNIAEYKLLLTKYINIFNANAVIPKNFSFIQRGLWLATTLIRDHKSDCSQIYTFKPYAVGYFSKDENTVSYAVIDAEWDYSDYKTMLETQSQNLFNAVGIVTMIADLRAAYGENVMQFTVDVNATAQFSESIHDLEQVHNLKTLPSKVVSGVVTPASIGATSLTLHQDNDGYLYQGILSGGDAYIPLRFSMSTSSDILSAIYPSISTKEANQYLNFFDEESVNPDMFLEATRLRMTVYTDFSGVGVGYYLVKNIGTEVIVLGSMFWIDPSNKTLKVENVSTDVMADGLIASYDKIMEDFVCQYGSFDWAPIMRINVLGNEGGFQYYIDIGEVDHAVILPNQNLRWLHTVAAFSEFYTEPTTPGRK